MSAADRVVTAPHQLVAGKVLLDGSPALCLLGRERAAHFGQLEHVVLGAAREGL